MKIIDAHIHIFSEIDGANANGPVKGCGLGRTINAGICSPFIPPISMETSWPVELLLECMEQNGVSQAVLFQNPTIGSVNDEVGQAILQYPDKLTGLVQVDPFDENAVALAEELIDRYPFAGIKLEVSTGWGWTGIHSDRDFHYSMLKPLVQVAEKHGLMVAFDTGDTDSAAYLPEELGELADQFPNVIFVIEHGGYLTPEGSLEKWEAMTDNAKKENVYLGICAVPSLMESEYPCTAGNAVLKKLYDKVGAEKLIWGTDGPCTFKAYTYRQLIDSVARYADFLDREDLERIFYKNAGKVYFKAESAG
ncbi:MAG: amidohydrolase [Lachnospiraceae bacterium]|nr:amidohydrolase [Lachnospiraceae bacterium]